MKLRSKAEQLDVHVGKNESDAFHQYVSTSQSWLGWLSKNPFMTDTFTLATFQKTCLIVASDEEYSVQLIVTCKGIIYSLNYSYSQRYCECQYLVASKQNNVSKKIALPVHEILRTYNSITV